MPLYIGDYQGDTQHLTRDEHGAYVLLLMAMWTAGGRLQNDPRRLANIAKASAAEWKALAPTIMAFFHLDEDGSLYQKRLLVERQRADQRSVARSEAGKRGGRPKSEKAIAFDLLKQNGSTRAQPLPLPLPEQNEDASHLCTKPPRRRSSYPSDFDDFWSAYPTDPLMSKKQAGAQWSKLTPDDRSLAMQAVPGFVAYCRANPEYRPVHAVRFLSQRRFEGFLVGKGSLAAEIADCLSSEEAAKRKAERDRLDNLRLHDPAEYRRVMDAWAADQQGEGH